MKRLILFVFLCSKISLYGQAPKAPFAFVNLGASGIGFMEASFLPVQTSQTRVTNTFFLSSITLSKGFIKPLLVFNSHRSIGASFSPAIALLIDREDLYNFRYDLPLTIGLNIGALASANAINIRGLGIEAGLNLVSKPLPDPYYKEYKLEDFNPYKPMLHAAFALKYRFWFSSFHRDDVLYEFELRASMGRKYTFKSYIPPTDNLIMNNRPAVFNLYFRKYLNY